MLYGNFTARQNLDFFAKLGGKPDLTKEDYYQVMRRVSLQEKAFEQRLKTFSKGMRQKLGISIAIIKDAPAILLDEPTSGLDPKAAEEFLEILGELKKEGKAILMSTHDIFRAKEIGDRVGIMKEGRWSWNEPARTSSMRTSSRSISTTWVGAAGHVRESRDKPPCAMLWVPAGKTRGKRANGSVRARLGRSRAC